MAATKDLGDQAAPHGAAWAVARTPEDLGKFLSRQRVQAGWTQRDLAAHLGFPYRYLHEIESGKHTLAYTRLFTLLRFLGVELRLENAAPGGEGIASRETTDFFADFDDLDEDYPRGNDR